MTHAEPNGTTHSLRKSVLELAPLELDCMNALWPMGEGTVREIRDELASRRPRAYTTIMTIMDRLARKGVVERQKVGRAYRYRPNLSAEQARLHALGQVVDGFFGGSTEAVVQQIATGGLSATVVKTVRGTPAKSSTKVAMKRPAPTVETEVAIHQAPSGLDETLL